MTSERLNEHDANQGAQSQGEFLGMTGNSAWYLLGAAGASVMLVILLWGVLGFSLVACLVLGAGLCTLSLGYVFALKNNKPAHYDTDIFESALIEAGLLALQFGPRDQRPFRPFGATVVVPAELTEAERQPTVMTRRRSAASVRNGSPESATKIAEPHREKVPDKKDSEHTVPLSAYEQLKGKLDTAEEALEEVLATAGDESVCD